MLLQNLELASIRTMLLRVVFPPLLFWFNSVMLFVSRQLLISALYLSIFFCGKHLWYSFPLTANCNPRNSKGFCLMFTRYVFSGARSSRNANFGPRFKIDIKGIIDHYRPPPITRLTVMTISSDESGAKSSATSLRRGAPPWLTSCTPSTANATPLHTRVA